VPGAPTTPPGQAEAASSPAAPASHRLPSIDLLRGIVMVLMALDHVRDHVHRGAFTYDPTDLSQAGPALFLTRWVTHFCAPVFVFLAGTGAFLWGARGRSPGEISRYLLTRGAWLVLLELTVVNWEWQMGIHFNFLIAQVIWALGWSMVALAVLVRLPVAAIAVVGCGMIAGHNLLDGIRPEALGALGPVWKVLHAPGPFEWAPGFTLYVMYPLVPWIGVMAAGYAFGSLYRRPPDRRRRALLAIGLLLTAGFVALRALNLYGDPAPWTAQRTGPLTLLSFLNCQKYPPSLLFLLMTLGPAILLLGALERGVAGFARPVVVFGRVPLFFYVVHLFVIDVLSVGLAVARYGSRTPELFAQGPPADFGYGLGVVYVLWIAVVVALYPVCRWYARVRARSRSPWLTYL